jgi:hypothetical protein
LHWRPDAAASRRNAARVQRFGYSPQWGRTGRLYLLNDRAAHWPQSDPHSPCWRRRYDVALAWASAAKFCSSTTRRTLRRPKKHSSPPSPSRNSSRRGALSCAALALAKLYQSTNRVADAHAMLAPALEGFSAATPEFAEIEQAQTLRAALKP